MQLLLHCSKNYLKQLMQDSPIKLNRKIELNQSQWQQYAEAGLVFSNEVTQPEQTEIAQYSLALITAADLSVFRDLLLELPQEMLTTLVKAYFDEDWSDFFENICDHKKLIIQSTPQTDGFLFLGDSRPIAWPMRTMMAEEISYQRSQFQDLGVTHSLAALEIEFSFSATAIDGFNEWIKKKNEILSTLTSTLAEKTGDELLETLEIIKEIGGFNAREILMFDVINDPRMEDYLQPLFGTSRDGNGYYDSIDCLELKTKPLDPIELLNIQPQIISLLLEKAQTYGLVLIGLPSYRVNMSFWDEQGNLLDQLHPAYPQQGKKIIEGLAAGMYDSFPFICGGGEMEKPSRIKGDFSINRENFLRLSDGRFELRLQNMTREQDIGASMVLLMASARYGLAEHSETVIAAQPIQTASMQHSPNQYKVLCHLLENSIIRADGYLDIPLNYAREKSAMIGYELGFTENPPHPMAGFYGLAPDFQENLIDFLKEIRIENDTIQFPVSDQDGFYLLRVPPINMDRIPEDLQQRVIAGEDPRYIAEITDHYIEAGEQLPQPEQLFIIDINKLQQHIYVKDIKQLYAIENGYDYNQQLDNLSLQESRIHRMLNSDVLESTLSSGFFTRLKQCLINKFPSSVPAIEKNFGHNTSLTP